MPIFEKSYDVGYSIEKIYDLVRDIESYPEFLPWCTYAKIICQGDDWCLADLGVMFKGISRRYRSKVLFEKPTARKARVFAQMVSGPFAHLTTEWILNEVVENKTTIHFFVDFKFDSFILDKISSVFFNKSCIAMQEAFLKRADFLYKQL